MAAFGAKLLEIKWVDSATATNSWEYRDEIRPLKPCRVVSVGFILEDKPEYITLAQSVSRSQVLGRITIPRVCITDARYVDKDGSS